MDSRVADGSLPILSSHYYRDNFLALCDTVQAQYSDLLTDSERQFLTDFRALDHASQCLYVRMVSRRGSLFRIEKLKYPEIGDISAPVAVLVAGGFVEPAVDLHWDEIEAIYTLPELSGAFAKRLQVPARLRKGQLLEAIQNALEHDQAASILALATGALTVRVFGEETVGLLQLLFFGNSHQTLTDFILSDLGLTRYYPYSLDRQHRMFCSREALEDYLACGVLRETFEELSSEDDHKGLVSLGNELLLKQDSFACSLPRWERLRLRLARVLERRGELRIAGQLYSACELPPARERRARIHEGLQEWREASVVCENIFAQPRSAAEHEAARKISHRVRRKMGEAVKRPAPDSFLEQRLQLVSESGSVERDAAAFLSSREQGVHYVENGLMNTLFALAFWEQIFLALPGAFHNPYQSVPADMYDGRFRARRSEEIARRLVELNTLDLHRELLACYRRYQGYSCRWADWGLVGESLLADTLDVVPKQHLLDIWARQLLDPAENRSGLPDLISLGQSPGDYCLIEVKGPGDTLQDNQKRWLRYFAQCDIPAKVAWVEWVDA